MGCPSHENAHALKQKLNSQNITLDGSRIWVEVAKTSEGLPGAKFLELINLSEHQSQKYITDLMEGSDMEIQPEILRIENNASSKNMLLKFQSEKDASVAG